MIKKDRTTKHEKRDEADLKNMRENAVAGKCKHGEHKEADEPGVEEYATKSGGRRLLGD